MNIYIVRHAQTEANKYAVIQGQSNTEITPEGLACAKKMAKSFSDKQITKIYTSPIKRAHVTAGLIADSCGISPNKIITDERLMEIDLKPWALKRIKELDASDDVSSYKTYKSNPSAFQPHSGENFFDVKSRMVEVFADIVKDCFEDDNIVIVSHSVAIRTLLIGLEEKPIELIWSYDLKPVSVTTVQVSQGEIELVEVGNTNC